MLRTSNWFAVAVITALIITASLYQVRIDRLELRLQELEEATPVRVDQTAEPGTSTNGSTRQHQDRTGISRVSETQRQKHPGEPADSVAQTPDSERTEDSPITPFLERGYVYAHELHDLPLADLDPEQNRQFWLQLNDALADNQLEVFDD